MWKGREEPYVRNGQIFFCKNMSISWRWGVRERDRLIFLLKVKVKVLTIKGY
jgi:hypothetical protein